MSLVGVIASLKTGSLYPVVRTANSTYDGNGILVTGATSTFNVVAVITPVSGRVLHRPPEGSHGDETKMVLTTTLLRALDPTSAGDKFTLATGPSGGSEIWEVFKLFTWEAFGETFYEAHIARRTRP